MARFEVHLVGQREALIFESDEEGLESLLNAAKRDRYVTGRLECCEQTGEYRPIGIASNRIEAVVELT